VSTSPYIKRTVAELDVQHALCGQAVQMKCRAFPATPTASGA
jgi:hypothetical protein